MSGYDDDRDRYDDWWDETGDDRFKGRMFMSLPEDMGYNT